jgi:phytanoyl-CoA dioxygenase PhyH
MLRQQDIDQFRDEGFLLHDLLEPEEVNLVRETLETLEQDGATGDPALTFVGRLLTEIFDVPRRAGVLARLVRHPCLLEMTMDLLGGPIQVSAGLMLDKSSGNNWEVNWHQDTSVYSSTIPIDLPGETRGGLPTFRPPDNTMASCVTARIAIDPASIDHGNLFVLPGTHRENLWPDGGKRFHGKRGIGCSQTAGSVLFFCPLIMHRAEKNQYVGSRRRVIHLTYRPAGLRLANSEWFQWPQSNPLRPVQSLWAE